MCSRKVPDIKKTPTSLESKSVLEKYVAIESPAMMTPLDVVSEWPQIWAEGKGATITDLDGNVYIDLTSGFSVANTGYCHPNVIEAIARQAQKLTHCKPRCANPVAAELLENLAEIAPGELKKVHFATGGAEAVETALKLAKFYMKKPEVLSFYGCYHGRSHATIALTGALFGGDKKGIYPIMPGVIHVPYAYCYRCAFGKEYPDCDLQCAKFVEQVFRDPSSGIVAIAAIIGEPIQGGGGHIVPPKEFWPEVRRICKENDALLILDEIYTGFGRTGKMFACEHWNVVPDIMTIGKALSGCLPISAALASPQLMDSWKGFSHSITFGANPIACAAAIANIEVIKEEGLVNRSAELGDYFMKGLKDLAERYEVIGDVRGKGLMIGIELVDDRTTKKPAESEAKRICLGLLKKGVLVDRAGIYGNVLRICPPLVIRQEHIDKSLELFSEVLKG